MQNGPIASDAARTDRDSFANGTGFAGHSLTTPGFVYFVRAGNSRFIKIGWATDVAARVRALQTGNSAVLKLLLALAGEQGLERQLHRQFHEHRSRGEWFHLADPLRAFIRAHGGEAPVPSWYLNQGKPVTADDVRAALDAASTGVWQSVKRPTHPSSFTRPQAEEPGARPRP